MVFASDVICMEVIQVSNFIEKIKKFRIGFLILMLAIVTFFIFYFQPNISAQSQNQNLSLNSPVSFPVDI